MLQSLTTDTLLPVNAFETANRNLLHTVKLT